MKNIYLTSLLAIVAIGCFSQTVVRMAMPKQADEALEVVTLFDESLPVNTTVVLGAIGYKISGGTAPYTLTWMKDSQVIATGDIAVIQPVSGSSYSLKVTDKNNCSYTSALNLNVSGKVKKQPTTDNKIIISPTIVTDRITISFTDNSLTSARIRIFDTHGILNLDKEISGNTSLPLQLPKGTYYVVAETENLHSAEKIIVK